MKDKELLILAAKAAGIDHPGGDHSIANDGRLWDCKALRWWNPLTDDGDALRLAASLKLTVRIDSIGAAARQNDGDTWEGVMSNPDSCAATRRAIVRAAAEIGKGMR